MNVERPGSIIVVRATEGVGEALSNTAADPAYHAERERTERLAAKAAASPESSQIHSRLAEAHSHLARARGT